MTTLGSLSKHPVQVVTPDATIHAAANLMREHHVGALIVVDDDADPLKPVGIVTDRDIVVAIVALALDPEIFLIDDLLGRPLVVAKATDPIHEGLALMKEKGIRRLPLLDKAGRLNGIVSLDDIIGEMAKTAGSVAAVIEREITEEFTLRASKTVAREKKPAKARRAS
jgi:CBS domain-containing protein